MLDEHKPLWLGKESDAVRAPLELIMMLCLLCISLLRLWEDLRAPPSA